METRRAERPEFPPGFGGEASIEKRRVLVCPSCGAPLPPSARSERVTCAFCKRVSESATREAERSDLVCPRCEAPLFEASVHDVMMLGCGACGGIWLDNTSAQRACAKYDDAVSELAHRTTAHVTTRPDVRADAPCAACRTIMQRRVVAGNVEIDFCVEHGTWFDAGELETMLSTLRAGPSNEPSPDPIPTQSSIGWSSLSGLGDVADVAGGVLEILGALASI